MSWSTFEFRVRLAPWNMFSCLNPNFLTGRSKAMLLLWVVFVICVLFLYLRYCLVGFLQLWSVTCWERADLLALLYVMFSCVCFFTFPYGVLGQVRDLIVLIPDLCSLPYFVWTRGLMTVFFKVTSRKTFFNEMLAKWLTFWWTNLCGNKLILTGT